MNDASNMPLWKMVDKTLGICAKKVGATKGIMPAPILTATMNRLCELLLKLTLERILSLDYGHQSLNLNDATRQAMSAFSRQLELF